MQEIEIGKITHFFAGAGTTGTISGVGRFLKKQNKNIKVILVPHNFFRYSSSLLSK